MKVLTLHQPWASLVALGVKHIETRGRWTGVRGRIAIHAAASSSHRVHDWPAGALDRFLVCGAPPHQAWLEYGADGYHALPFGALVATADLYDCVPMLDAAASTEATHNRWSHIRVAGGGDVVSMLVPQPDGYNVWFPLHRQAALGDFRPGRFAWMLRDITPLDPPVPFTGGQGWSRTWEPS